MSGKGGKFSRDKGMREENRVCALLKGLGFTAMRLLSQYQESGGRDITTSANLCIQCKTGKNLSAKGAYLEAEASAVPGEHSVAWLHWTNGPRLVMIDEQYFLDLLLSAYQPGPKAITADEREVDDGKD